MRAVTLKGFGGPEVLLIEDVPAPTLRPGSVRVRVRATALNRADLSQRHGHYPPPPGESEILGLEMAGEVIELADDVRGVDVGARVMALLPGGGYAEEVVVDAGMLMPLPDNLSFEQGAAIPEVYLTAYSNLMWLGQMKSGSTVLIHAGASGVGTAAIQLVKALGGTAIVTAGTKDKRDFCATLGASAALDYKAGPFAPDVLALTGGQGVNIIFDFVGAPYLEQNIACLATDGKLIVIGTMGGARAQDLDLSMLLRKRLQIIGTALRSRPLLQKVELTRQFAAFALPLFANGSLRPIVDQVYDWAAVAEAHRYMERNENIGKIVLSL